MRWEREGVGVRRGKEGVERVGRSTRDGEGEERRDEVGEREWEMKGKIDDSGRGEGKETQDA